MKKTGLSTYKVALCGVLLGIMLVLGFVESMIPLPTPAPGIKLGLSNGVLIFALYTMDFPTTFLLMTLKVVLSGIMFGGVSGIMYGFAGGVLSLLAMYLLKRLKIHTVVVSVAGGAMHNLGQVILAMIMLSTPGLIYYGAVLMVVGGICGALTGVCAMGVLKSFGKKIK